MKQSIPQKPLSKLLWLATLLTAQFAAAAPTPKISWPVPEWEFDGSYLKKKNSALERMEKILFFDSKQDPRAPVTDAALVVKAGKIIYERYANGFSSTSRHIAWSATKSVTNAVLGAAILDGKLKLEDSICQYLKAPRKSQCEIRVDHLARHSSGLDWSEDYEDSKQPKDSAVLAMLYGEGIADMAKFTLNLHKNAYPPGTHWNYSSGDSNLLAAVLAKAIGEPNFRSYPWKRIFEPLGIRSFLWESDAQGVFVASSYLYGSARDLARFGLLYARNGEWNGKEILPKTWVDYSRAMAPAIPNTQQKLKTAEPPNMYGAHWWLNLSNPKQGYGPPWPHNPENIFAAMGHWGQYIFIVPDEDLVIVRLGNDRFQRMNNDALLTAVREFAQ